VEHGEVPGGFPPLVGELVVLRWIVAHALDHGVVTTLRRRVVVIAT
jgi:hypothetical protein